MDVPQVIATERLRLRKPEITDAESIFAEYAQDSIVTRYLIWQPHQSIEETNQFLSTCLTRWETAAGFPLVITDKNSGQLMGMVEIRIEKHTANLGYVIARKYWGNGYVPEAAKAMVDWALSQPEIFRVWAICDVDNHASARVLEKIGMQREGIFRRMIMHPGVSDEPRDALCYAIVK